MKVHDRNRLSDALGEAVAALVTEQPDQEHDVVKIALGFQKNIKSGRYDHAETGPADFMIHARLAGHEVASPALERVLARMQAGEFLTTVEE